MRALLVEILHIFIIAVMLGFGVVCLVASSGRFDHWNQRLKRTKPDDQKNNYKDVNRAA